MVRLSSGVEPRRGGARVATVTVAALARPAKKAAKKAVPKSGKVPRKSATSAASSRSHTPVAAARTAFPPAPRRVAPAAALAIFEQAVELVHRQDWRGAARLFAELRGSFPEEVELLDRVQTYARVAERNLARVPFEPRTAEDHYQAGIVQLNSGAIDKAVDHLGRALVLESSLDKAEYALAAAHALGDAGEAALRHLRRAIELNPDNRIYAANDSDFESLRRETEFVELVGGGEWRDAGRRRVGDDAE